MPDVRSAGSEFQNIVLFSLPSAIICKKESHIQMGKYGLADQKLRKARLLVSSIIFCHYHGMEKLMPNNGH